MSECANHSKLSCGCHSRVADYFLPALEKWVLDHSQSHSVKKTTSASPLQALLVHTGGGQGTIRPVSGGDAEIEVEALGVLGTRVIATGLIADVRSALEAAIETSSPGLSITERALTQGECLLPGLIDPHLHIVPTALTISWPDYSPFGSKALDDQDGTLQPPSQNLRPNYSLDSLYKALLTDIKGVGETEWLLGNRVDPSLFETTPKDNKTLLDVIDYKFLDGVSSSKPILLLSASGHTAYVNTAAMQEIWDSNSDVREKYATFQKYQIETNGALQEDEGIFPALSAINQHQKEQLIENINDSLYLFFSLARDRGITLMYDAGMMSQMEGPLRSYLCTSEGQSIPIRIGMAHSVHTESEVEALGTFSCPVEAPSKEEESDINFYFGSIKVVSDGSNQGLTGYQSTPYKCPPVGAYGLYNYLDEGKPQTTKPSSDAPPDVCSLIQAIWDKGWQTMIHANGDQAITYALQAFEKVRSNVEKVDPERAREIFKARRNRIEHCSLLDDDLVNGMAELNLAPSFLIGHVGYWGSAFSTYIFGDKAVSQLDRCESARKKEIRFTLHSDCGVSPLGPLRLMEQAVTRKMEASQEARRGDPAEKIPSLNPEEQITPAQALRAVTYDAAWQCQADTLVGSLEPNKLADFIILGQDPVTMGVNEAYKVMRDIPVKEVWIGGAKIL